MNELQKALNGTNGELDFYLESIATEQFRQDVEGLLKSREGRGEQELKQKLIQAIQAA